MVCDTTEYLHTALKMQKRVLVEGANAAMLDIDFGRISILLASNLNRL